MNIKSQALQLRDFINRYTLMWNDEIMNEYPESIAHYPKEWIDLLDSLSASELYAIDCKQSVEKIKGSSFESFMQEALELSLLPLIPESPEIPLEDWAYNGVKKKKRHEIQKIVPRLKDVRDRDHFDYVVDIGGGVGHLSRVLSHYHAIPSISLDQNAEFQKIGEERLHKFRKLDGSRDVKFVNLTFGENAHVELLKDIFSPRSFSLGLHTCGPLANILIQNSIDFKTKGLLSFGCCYHRMNPQTDFPLSTFYKDEQFPKLNLFALSLATRSHAEMPREVYDTKERVKYYRYALHLFLMRHFNNKYFTDVGECHIRTYWEPFSDYIRGRLAELKLEHQFSDDFFNDFYNDPTLQRELRMMFLCNIIRWQLGRPLEVFLLLDRCLYLIEHGYEVKIEQYFTEALSPRNIGILALLIN
ncbi:MAG: methyltransferase [Bacteriovorax sp.]